MNTNTLNTDWADPQQIALAQNGLSRGTSTAYYDPVRKSYWRENAQGIWVEVNENSLKRFLKEEGLNSKCEKGAYVSEIDARLNSIQHELCVTYPGPLAGYRAGVYEICGNLVLVTSSPKLIEPKPGPWPNLGKVMENLFVDGERDQRAYVLGWLKVAYEALRAQRRRPGQALVLAGEKDCGKSLLQNLFTPILGGRAAKPYRYMSGNTDFNSELIGAEHLMIEDEVASTDIRARRHFGARIKDFTVNEVQSCHPKNRPAMSLTPFWRVSMSVNCEPENLMILPPLDESLSDKIILLKVQKHDMPMPTGTDEERKLFWNALISELPGFLSDLCRWDIPKELRSERFGVTHFHHPELLESIEGLAPETRLLSLIDDVVFGGSNEVIKVVPPSRWSGTAEQLQNLLMESSMRDQARALLLDWPFATGTYLGRLAKKRPERVQKERKGDDRIWTIFPQRSDPSSALP